MCGSVDWEYKQETRFCKTVTRTKHSINAIVLKAYIRNLSKLLHSAQYSLHNALNKKNDWEIIREVNGRSVRESLSNQLT